MLVIRSEGHLSQSFLLKGGPNCHALLFLGVAAEHLDYVVLGICNGDWTKEKDGRVLTGPQGFSLMGSQILVGLLGRTGPQ